MSEIPIPLFVPNLTGNAAQYVNECIKTNYVSSIGPFVDRFEKEFSAHVNSRYAVATASGTAAIHLAMRLAGVGPGDEVFVPTLTFIASANPIVYEKAIPVFVDAEAETWNLDPDLVLEELNRRAKTGSKQPKAIEVVHILGHPAKLEALVDTCKRFGIIIIEDAAEAAGGRYISGMLAGRHVGTVGHIGCFSFNGNKIITTGGGGMLVTDQEDLARRAKHLSTQAKRPGVDYQHDEVGYNYRLTNLAAALGVAQLEQLNDFIEKKRQIAARYNKAFKSIEGITLPPNSSWAFATFWLYSICIDPAEFGCDYLTLLNHLSSKGIETRPIWSPLHTQPMYRDAKFLGSGVAEALASCALSLPCSVGLGLEEQERVIHEILSVRATK